MAQDPPPSPSDTPQPLPLNPYQTGGDPLAVDSDGTDHRFVSSKVNEIAKWQTFFSVILFIGVAMIFATFLMAVTMGGGSFAESLTGLLCMGGAILIFYALPAIMLWKAASSARRYAKSGSSAQLSEFTSGQVVLWRTLGILAAIVLVLYVVMIFFALVGTVSMASR